MPHQDQLYAIWRPKTWDEFREFVEERGVVEPAPTAAVPALERYEYLVETLGEHVFAQVDVPELTRFVLGDRGGDPNTLTTTHEVGVICANWDAHNGEQAAIVDPDESGRLWFGVGIPLTGRYFPVALDIEMMPGAEDQLRDNGGRPDFFEIDMGLCTLACVAVAAAIKRQVVLALICQFY